jgi:hypothetical protein
LELDASSSTSPRRGSMAGFKQLLQRPATVLSYHARQRHLVRTLGEYIECASVAAQKSLAPR